MMNIFVTYGFDFSAKCRSPGIPCTIKSARAKDGTRNISGDSFRRGGESNFASSSSTFFSPYSHVFIDFETVHGLVCRAAPLLLEVL